MFRGCRGANRGLEEDGESVFDKLVAFRLVEACFYASRFSFKIMEKSAELAFCEHPEEYGEFVLMF